MILGLLVFYDVFAGPLTSWLDTGKIHLPVVMRSYESGQEPAKSPLLISEVMYAPAGAEPVDEWIELYNPGAKAVELSHYKIGDEETQGSEEGMLNFPAGAQLDPGAVLIIANCSVDFQAQYGFAANYEMQDTDPTVPDLLPSLFWAGGTVELANTGDEVLMLDDEHRLVDALSWGDSTFAFNPPVAAVETGYSLERRPADRDTDTSRDWVGQAEPNPGEVMLSLPTPVSTPTSTITSTPTPAAPSTATASPTSASTPTHTATASPTPTATPSPAPTYTPELSPTAPPPPATDTPTSSPTSTPSITPVPASATPDLTSTPSPTPPSSPTTSATPTCTSTVTALPASPTLEPTSTETPLPTENATSTPLPTSTPTGTAAPPPSGDNLLINGDFSNGFEGWNQVNDFWRIHDITGSECSQQNPDWPLTMAEMDRDDCDDCNSWPVGGEDWLWQDIVAPGPHLTVTLTLTEAHHMHSGTAELTLYGGEVGAWQVIFHRPAPEAAYGAGHFCETPPSFTYSFPGGYPSYRLEIHGHLKEPEDGWIIGPLVLTIQ
jgi:hypothetical protein